MSRYNFNNQSIYIKYVKYHNVQTYFVLQLWDYRYSHCIGMYKGHEASISSLKYSPDGLWIASGDEDGCVKVSY